MNAPMNIYIVDDSRLARQELKTLLTGIADIRVVGENGDPRAAQQEIDSLHPDLLLLDIDMPGVNGFELLESLVHVPAVIFVTAFDEHAVRAFEVNALDYLMKPVVPDRLRGALEKVRAAHKRKAEPRSSDDRIFIRAEDRIWLVKLRDIPLLEVVGNYTRMHIGADRPLVPKSLRQLQDRLDPKVFVRVNRAQIINVEWIESAAPDAGDGLILKLRNGVSVEVSRRQAQQLEELLRI
jgi:two-component system LytT family response regulator